MAHLLLHGFLGSVDDWPAHIPGERVHYPDVTGHTFDQGIHTLYTHIHTTYGPGPHTLTGYSMGGRLALAIAIAHPALVTTLTLISSSPGIADPALRASRYIADLALATTLDTQHLPEFLDAWYSQPMFATLKTSRHYTDILTRRLAITPTTQANILRTFSIGHQPSFWDHLRHLHIKTALITGTLDTKYTQIAAQMVAINPELHWEQLPNRDHYVLI